MAMGEHSGDYGVVYAGTVFGQRGLGGRGYRALEGGLKRLTRGKSVDQEDKGSG